MTHTPGPFKVYHKRLRPQFKTKIIEVQDRFGRAVIAWQGFDSCDMPVKTKLANAHLFAAAPETAAERDRLKAINAELLAALVAMHTLMSNRILGSGGSPSESLVLRQKCLVACDRAREAIAKAEPSSQ